MDVYVWVCLCVRGCMAKEGILSPASLKRRQSIQKSFFCLLWREDHTKSCVRENLRDGKRRMKRVIQLGGETPKQSVRSIELRHKAMKTMARWVSILVAVSDFRWVFTLAITNTHRMLKSTRLHLVGLRCLVNILLPQFMLAHNWKANEVKRCKTTRTKEHSKQSSINKN